MLMRLILNTHYPLLSISYANYVQQYLQTICIKKNYQMKIHGIMIHQYAKIVSL